MIHTIYIYIITAFHVSFKTRLTPTLLRMLPDTVRRKGEALTAPRLNREQ